METITLPKETALNIAMMLSVHNRIDVLDRDRISAIEDENEMLTEMLECYANAWRERCRIHLEAMKGIQKLCNERLKEQKEQLKRGKLW